MRTSRVKLEINCFLLEALVFSFGGLLGFFSHSLWDFKRPRR